MTTCKGLNSKTQKSFPPSPLSVSHSLPLHFLTLSLFTLALCLHSRSLVHWRYLSLSLCPLSGSLALSTSLHFCALKVFLRLCALRFNKRLVFYFVYVGKTCKGCSFKWFSCKRIFLFVFVEWFACKAWAFMQFLIEKHVKVALLSDFSCKMIFFLFVVWFSCKVWVFMRFLMEKHVKVALLSDFSCKMMFFFCLWFDSV